MRKNADAAGIPEFNRCAVNLLETITVVVRIHIV